MGSSSSSSGGGGTTVSFKTSDNDGAAAATPAPMRSPRAPAQTVGWRRRGRRGGCAVAAEDGGGALGRGCRPPRRRSTWRLSSPSATEWRRASEAEKWYLGRVTADNGDLTYDIEYDDGDEEKGGGVARARPARSLSKASQAMKAAVKDIEVETTGALSQVAVVSRPSMGGGAWTKTKEEKKEEVGSSSAAERGFESSRGFGGDDEGGRSYGVVHSGRDD